MNVVNMRPEKDNQLQFLNQCSWSDTPLKGSQNSVLLQGIKRVKTLYFTWILYRIFRSKDLQQLRAYICPCRECQFWFSRLRRWREADSHPAHILPTIEQQCDQLPTTMWEKLMLAYQYVTNKSEYTEGKFYLH